MNKTNTKFKDRKCRSPHTERSIHNFAPIPDIPRCTLPLIFFELFYSIKQGNEYMYRNSDLSIDFSHATFSLIQSRQSFMLFLYTDAKRRHICKNKADVSKVFNDLVYAFFLYSIYFQLYPDEEGRGSNLQHSLGLIENFLEAQFDIIIPFIFPPEFYKGKNFKNKKRKIDN
jgi:hypothetical protein